MTTSPGSSTAGRERASAGGAQRLAPAAHGTHLGRRGGRGRPGSMTGAPIPTPASGPGSPRRSCRRGVADPEDRRGVAAALPARAVLGRFRPALGQFLGSTAGLSAPVITKLTRPWKAEQRSFSERDLSQADYVYLWADGIHVNIRLEEHKLCLLVMIGVRADGRKELVALTDGYRESAESWADLLRDCARRGMRAPVLAMGDGALGSGARCGRCSPARENSAVGSTRSPTFSVPYPKSAHPGAKKALAEIWNAEDKQHALDAVSSFKTAYGAKFGKAVAKITDDTRAVVGVLRLPRRALDSLAAHRSQSSTTSRPCDAARRSPAAPDHARPD